MHYLEFKVNPVAKGRSRSTRNGHHYTPKKTVNAEAELRWLMQQQWKNPPLEGPITIVVKFYFQRPKSVSEKKRKLPITKPDWDNVSKIVGDAGNGILWRDDSQICKAFVDKIYSDESKITLLFSECD